MLNWSGGTGRGGSMKRASQRVFRHGPELLAVECDVLSILDSAGPEIVKR
jgi:hypothetical protein